MTDLHICHWHSLDWQRLDRCALTSNQRYVLLHQASRGSFDKIYIY